MKYFILGCLVFILSACATTEKYSLDTEISSKDAATLHFYRTDTYVHSLNPETPYTYLDDKVIAKLRTGMQKIVKVKPGRYTVSVRQPMLFMPGLESESFTHTFVAGEDYYVRYDLSNILYGPHTQTSLSLTSKENFLNKK
jgi:hypothetical protein